MKIPKIKYHSKGRSTQQGFIELDGECAHEIQDLDAFYKIFGYTTEMAKAGILPEEFVWEKYIKDNAKYTHCLQIHLIDYLKDHSAIFREKFGAKVGAWIAAHAEATTVRGDLCATCRMQAICSA